MEQLNDTIMLSLACMLLSGSVIVIPEAKFKKKFLFNFYIFFIYFFYDNKFDASAQVNRNSYIKLVSI